MTNDHEEITFQQFDEWLVSQGIDRAGHLAKFNTRTRERVERLIQFEISAKNKKTRKGWTYFYVYTLLARIAPESGHELITEFLMALISVVPESAEHNLF